MNLKYSGLVLGEGRSGHFEVNENEFGNILLQKYNDFVEKNELGNIHQLIEWGKFQSMDQMREKFWLIVVKNEHNQIVASALVIKQTLPMGKCWFYVPRGPLIDWQDENWKEILQILLAQLKTLAKTEKAVFLRIDPGLTLKNGQVIGVAGDFFAELKQLGLKKAHAHYQPENTLMIDLSQSEDEILAQMKPKGRYNIKVAIKKGVKIVDFNENSVSDKVDLFYQIFQETTARDGFSGHKKQYYENLLNNLPENAEILLAQYQGKVIAGMLITFYKDLAIYYFGASSNENRNVMAPYLLQWTAMKIAKERGCSWYDFLGIAPEDASKNHAWAGVTDFKLKFGGKRVDYLPAQELVYNLPFFWLMRLKKLINSLFKAR